MKSNPLLYAELILFLGIVRVLSQILAQARDYSNTRSMHTAVLRTSKRCSRGGWLVGAYHVPQAPCARSPLLSSFSSSPSHLSLPVSLTPLSSSQGLKKCKNSRQKEAIIMNHA